MAEKESNNKTNNEPEIDLFADATSDDELSQLQDDFYALLDNESSNTHSDPDDMGMALESSSLETPSSSTRSADTTETPEEELALFEAEDEAVFDDYPAETGVMLSDEHLAETSEAESDETESSALNAVNEEPAEAESMLLGDLLSEISEPTDKAQNAEADSMDDTAVADIALACSAAHLSDELSHLEKSGESKSATVEETAAFDEQHDDFLAHLNKEPETQDIDNHKQSKAAVATHHIPPQHSNNHPLAIAATILLIFAAATYWLMTGEPETTTVVAQKEEPQVPNPENKKVEAADIASIKESNIQPAVKELVSKVTTTPKAPIKPAVQQLSNNKIATIKPSTPIQDLTVKTATAVITVDKAGDWILYLASVKSAKSARQYVARIQAMGVKSKAVEIRDKGRIFHRIRISGFTDKLAAHKRQSTLIKKLGLRGSWIEKL